MSSSRRDLQRQRKPLGHLTRPRRHTSLTGLLTALLLLLISSTSPSSSAPVMGPPSNLLNLFVRYDVAWLDPNAGTFGGNFTIFRKLSDCMEASQTTNPTSVTAVSNGSGGGSGSGNGTHSWGIMFNFPSRSTSITNVEGSAQWMLAADNDTMSFVVVMSDDVALSKNVDPSLASADAAMGMKRFNMFFNGTVEAPAHISDLSPVNYTLVLADLSSSATDPSSSSSPSSSSPQTFPLADQTDFMNIPVRPDIARAPFGPYLGVSSAVSGTNNSPGNGTSADASDISPGDNPSPLGTTFIGSPIGLVIFLGYLTIGSSFFAIGTLNRIAYRSQFLKNQEYVKSTTDLARSLRNPFLAEK